MVEIIGGRDPRQGQGEQWGQGTPGGKSHECSHDLMHLPLLPLKNVVIVPKSITPIIVGRPLSVAAVEYALRENRAIFVTAQIQTETEIPTPADVYTYGTRSTILQVMRMPKGALKILVEGMSRSHAVAIEHQGIFLTAQCHDLPTTNLQRDIDVEALWRHLQSLYQAYIRYNTKSPADLMHGIKTVEDMDLITDTLLTNINLSFAERQAFLELTDFKERLTRTCEFFKRELSVIETEEKIRGQVQSQVEKNQREYYLTEQMKAIQKELGRDDQQQDIDALKATLKEAHLPAEAHARAEKEINRLSEMPAMSAEATVSRHYIDWLLGLPWHAVTKDSISLEAAEKILDTNHAGLKKVKERILEFLAAKKFSSQLNRSPILCLVGPPGVGKTSLAQSIAESLGRNFARISLGGVRDEAEIRGHRRTYIGSLPGKIIHALRKTQTINPVILIDEIDKIASDAHGDPASALLEVLDPEQNKSFVDHFLEVEYDLSNVMFIATANQLDTIPYPLFDRMEIIPLSGYTEEEKIQISNDFLIPKNLKLHGLTQARCKIPLTTLRILINGYTKEAGVRQLERTISKLMRKTIQVLLKEPKTKSVTVSAKVLKEWLGSVKYKPMLNPQLDDRIGLATGLAWTELGGDILEVEATVVPGKSNVTLTGQLGEVMQESAQAALTYVKSRASKLALPANFNASKDIHIHVPEGATPKDGPSAGITICTALISALTKNPTNPTVAMTGEITLRGRILPIGGLKEKILAARQQGIIKTLIVPHENKDELEEIKTEVKTDELTFVCAKTMDEVLKIALKNDPFQKNAPKNHAQSTTQYHGAHLARQQAKRHCKQSSKRTRCRSLRRK